MGSLVGSLARISMPGTHGAFAPKRPASWWPSSTAGHASRIRTLLQTSGGTRARFLAMAWMTTATDTSMTYMASTPSRIMAIQAMTLDTAVTWQESLVLLATTVPEWSAFVGKCSS